MPEPVAIIRRSFAGLQFDATISEDHTLETEVTENPIERGSAVSDHAFDHSDRLEIEAAVSNAPLHADPSDPFRGARTRVERAWEMLREIQQRHEPIDVQTGLGLYRDMMVVSLRAKQDKDSGQILGFTASLQQVNITSTQTVKYPPRKPGKPHRQAAKKTNAGEQQAKPAAQPAEGETRRPESFLKSLFGENKKDVNFDSIVDSGSVM